MKLSPLTATCLLALAAANAALLVVIAGEYLQAADAAVGPLEWSPKLSTASEAVLPVRGAESYAQTLAHPVFFKSREPFVAPPPAPPPVAKAPAPPVNADPGLVLAGVMIAGGHRKAYLVNKADSSGTWTSEGETLAGWKVQAVQPTAVKLQQQDRTIELLLYPRHEEGAADATPPCQPGGLPPAQPFPPLPPAPGAGPFGAQRVASQVPFAPPPPCASPR
jgi:hypothetical protein